ncbi:hypothetical protein HOK51_03040 [Candidatus Woesearchaeota archaeon]|jgi:hypothetical protein|nr:hypothetical protein [Candidatus Woesearchaeota archaeon]MBT6518794.1 hypothetical protein [Candidatus Woesearchaeota archaeon]MBT7367933.1 hypothetical protein [Candidatus Woesearchaeota archaeon]
MSDKPEIGVILNPGAKKNKKRPYRKHELKAIVGDRGIVRETSCIEELEDVVDEFLETGIKHTQFVGGDGTTQNGITALLNKLAKLNTEKLARAKRRSPNNVTNAKIIELPYLHPGNAGTINFAARLAKVKGTPEYNLKQLVDVCEKNLNFSTFPVQTLEIRTYPKGEPTNLQGREFGFVFGDAAVANFINKYYGNEETQQARKIWRVLAGLEQKFEKKLLGTEYASKYIDKIVQDTFYEIDRPDAIKALRLIGKSLASFVLRTNYHRELIDPKKATVFVDGETLPYDKFNILIASAMKINVIGFSPFYRLDQRNENSGIHVLAGNMPAFDIAFDFLQTIKPDFEPKNGFKNCYDGLAKEMIIEVEKGSKYTIDAEIKKASTVIEIRPGPRLFIPEIYSRGSADIIDLLKYSLPIL